MYSPQFSNLVKSLMKNVKNCSLSLQAVEITFLEALRQVKINFELMKGGENKIYQFLS